MKVFLVVLCLIACAFAEEWTVKNSEQLKEIRVECLKEHALSAEQMSKMKNFEFPNEEVVRKYLLCTAVKMGIFCTQTGYHTDRIAKQFKMDMDEAEVQKLAEDCIAKFPKGDKANDVAAFEVHGCLMNSAIGEKVKNYIKQRSEAAQSSKQINFYAKN